MVYKLFHTPKNLLPENSNPLTWTHSYIYTDAAGRELLNTKVSTHNFQLSISQYPAGTYFVTFRTPDAASTQRLVVK